MAQIIFAHGQGPMEAEMHEVAIKEAMTTTNITKTFFAARDLNATIAEMNRAPKETELVIMDFGWAQPYIANIRSDLKGTNAGTVPILTIFGLGKTPRTKTSLADYVNEIGVIPLPSRSTSHLPDIYAEFLKLQAQMGSRQITKIDFSPKIQDVLSRPQRSSTELLRRAMSLQAARAGA